MKRFYECLLLHIIVRANHLLPDGHTQKITWIRCHYLRSIADKLHDGSGGYLRAMADALESLLHPSER